MARIRKLTIPATPGSAYVESAQLVTVELLSVHRNGVQHVITSAMPASGALEAYYEVATGKIYFAADNPFGSTETVFVLYRLGGVIPTPMPEEPPVTGTPNNMSIVSSVTAGTIDNVSPYFFAATPGYFPVLPGQTKIATQNGHTGDITINITNPGDKPRFIELDINGSNFYTGSAINGTNTVPGATLLPTDTLLIKFIETIPPLPPAANMGVLKVIPDTRYQIISVTGFSYAILSGSFPLVADDASIDALHSGFNTAIVVTVQLPSFGRATVGLYKNGPQIEYKAVARSFTAGTAIATFTAVNVLPTDDIHILLDYF